MQSNQMTLFRGPQPKKGRDHGESINGPPQEPESVWDAWGITGLIHMCLENALKQLNQWSSDTPDLEIQRQLQHLQAKKLHPSQSQQ